MTTELGGMTTELGPRPFPTSISGALESVHWPLDPALNPPMHFVPLEKMAEIRRNSPPPSKFSDGSSEVDVLGIVSALRSSDDHSDEYMARTAAALILLGHGFCDEAHNLVSPLSWPKDLPFMYGPPVATSPEILALASYAHCLVHRREGPHKSEFGMTGFGNADYWAGAALRSEGDESLPLHEIRQAVLQLADGDTHAQEWVRDNVTNGQSFGDWDPRFLTQLCAEVIAADGKHVLKDFAERAAEAEVRILLKTILMKMGYDCTTA